MWVKYIEQDWYKEDPEIYLDELNEVCRELNCNPEDVYIRTSDDDDYDDVMLLINDRVGLFTEDSITYFSKYLEGGLLCVFKIIKL